MKILLDQLNTLTKSGRETLWPISVLVAVFAFWFILDPDGWDVFKHPILITNIAMAIATVFVILDLKASVESSAADQALYLAAEVANESGPTISDYKAAFAVYIDLVAACKHGIHQQES